MKSMGLLWGKVHVPNMRSIYAIMVYTLIWWLMVHWKIIFINSDTHHLEFNTLASPNYSNVITFLFVLFCFHKIKQLFDHEMRNYNYLQALISCVVICYISYVIHISKLYTFYYYKLWPDLGKHVSTHPVFLIWR